MNYDHKKIEAFWQAYWAEHQTFKANNATDKPKYYVLDMFPYPSGAGLHVGHPLGYIASDIVARYKRHKGFNVLHPQGYDSFGLPAEQYAIATGQHPAITTAQNIARYREQLDKMGFSFDWSREVKTSDPNYYKNTQWIFAQLFEAWYDKNADKAQPISALIDIFTSQGNGKVNAACDDDTPTFSAEEWNAFPPERQQEILLKYRLTYLAETEVNWCPALGTVLANDEVINGRSERGGHPVIRKKMTQWSMRITAYAERLLTGLQSIDWSESIKESQRNWIGKSVGASITFHLQNSNENDPVIEVFTTRPDTIYGVTYLTLAPEHPLVEQITSTAQQQAVLQYKEEASKRSERDRMADTKTISGVFTGAYALHPLTHQPIPIWVGDYVLSNYGTGAVMAVPAGDDRDFAFAQFFKGKTGMPAIKNIFDKDISEGAYTEKGGFKLQNSDVLNGLDYKEAFTKAIETLIAAKSGARKVNYRLRDAVFSRQRYWGEPFPVYYVNNLPQLIDEKYYPILLPEVEKYLPTETGEPPLGNASVWAWDTESGAVVENAKVNNTTVFPMELNTMPGWAGSSWYWLSYMRDAAHREGFPESAEVNYWRDVDLYVGGSEHATGHLLYSRFWNKFLKDIGRVSVEEPFTKLINQGMILGMSAFAYRLEGTNTFVSKNRINGRKVQPLHVDISLLKDVTDELDIDKFKSWRADYANAEFELEDGRYLCGREVEKMSKSKYNVVNPDDICMQYGADTLRLYEMFLGPIDQAKPWNTAGISGVYNFLRKLWRLYAGENGLQVNDETPTEGMLKSLHKTIKKVNEDIESFSFNTSISQFMICVNELSAQKCRSRAVLEPLVVLLSPFAPHIAEELWHLLGHNQSVEYTPYPLHEDKYLVESTKEYPVSFNGKVRFKRDFPADMAPSEIEKAILADAQTVAQLAGASPKKVIVVPNKIINIVM
ncbi:leucyl-tRNA synthetase [Capnocytophaga haemolytica]|uniref:Leucine--tRNA ligase n=1 Tax=Capnocytophaga haemolytica TaxID=45243 RepID=A0AAX2GZ11_9FLAO|nr:leucine--tRNA ligase [Capnocytophaga haemolytica]AMD84194.1 leucine--tRNA ligase [Capnocytophaga haemolytica]SFN94022.1 leucyl-tRNA synthetase [Capnocytophaga haemolytica]SNV12763.1 Leucine--tRNA ligase [Capnocytophaga haemolytica]